MLKENIEKNSKVKPNSYQVKVLKECFPQFFNKEIEFNFDKFKEFIQASDINISKEGYELNFLGKSYARLQVGTETKTVITPNIEHNRIEGNRKSENIYIVGDNLDALKHLLKSYEGQIKCIYIDPPYNTGNNDFIYPDNFEYNTELLAKQADITEEEANRILNMAGSSTHSAWLTFMYPRLFLAKDLLKKEGFIFISIDDNEQGNLKLLCDEIFGENNFIGNITVQTNKGGQDYLALAKTHEYLLCYSKNEDALLNKLDNENLCRTMEDKLGTYELRELRNRNPKFNKANRPNLYYPIYVNPNEFDDNKCNSISCEKTEEFTIEVFPLNSKGEASCWRWGLPKLKKETNGHTIDECPIVARKKKDGNYNIYEKYRGTQSKAKTIWEIEDGEYIWDKSEYRTESGTKRLSQLLGKAYFDHPKPVELIERIIELACDKSDIILDFFSGSATTAEAVMKSNAVKNRNNKYICVQLPVNLDEVLDNAKSNDKEKYRQAIEFLDSIKKPHLLSEIGIERIKRAAENIEADTKKHIDYGFKIYNLNTPNQNTLDKIISFDNAINTLIPENYEEMFAFNNASGKETILQTWKIDDGYGFMAEDIEITLDKYVCNLCENTLYLIDTGITREDIMSLIEMIENGKINIDRIILFGYSFSYNQLEELKKNIALIKNVNSIRVIERF
ncbi:dNA (Cytosine-5-)-methyltransferase [Clostridium sp. CAG:221]|uniref:site-specific DNA-methyltransferase n=1 Tax=Clostridium sp. CAG:221 TaxID=1262780 RepID=UPI000337EDFC|nr:site-specific DNA-methyltransferase [Clostridium sp. CAG:221]CDB16269.1 dNA (Cytosine-5-)-methyltransferase [Clostridium sp. CAG:221]